MAKFVYPRLKKFKKENIGFPHEFKTIDEWNEILDKMLFSFKVLKEDCVGLAVLLRGSEHPADRLCAGPERSDDPLRPAPGPGAAEADPEGGVRL